MRTLLLSCCLALTASASPTPNDVRTRAATAARQSLGRHHEYTPKVPSQPDASDQIKALAIQGRDRGKEALQQLRTEAARAEPPEPGNTAVSVHPLQGRVLVALSASMPEAMLTSYMAQLDGHPESLVVLRGFIGGAQKVRPTGAFMEKIRRKTPSDPGGPHYRVETIVDPLVYAQLAIDQVPAVAYLPGVTTLSHCNREDYSKAVVVYGAAAIEAALRTARASGAPVPETVIAHYRGTGWEQKR